MRRNMMKTVRTGTYLLKISSPLLPFLTYLDYWTIFEMKNWTMIKLLPPKLDGTDLKTDVIWTLYEHEIREEQEYMEKKIERTSLLSADVTFQKSIPLPPHRQAQCHLRGGIQDVQGNLFVLHSFLVVPGTEQHGNCWINSMKVIVSVVNSITAFWFCFI